MSSEWRISELGKEAFNASRPFSFKTHPQVVFVNTGDVLHGNFLHADISDGAVLPGQAKKALKQNDILLTEIRPGNGRYAFVDFPADKYVVSTKFMVIESRGRVIPKFLYHVLTNQSALDEFQRIAESRSGTFPQITFDSIEHFPVPVPPPSVQDELVKFFDAIDDRITLLRETNTTIEAVAQALFKSWFVDFDPVHDKMQGRAPEGMDEATAALFPDSFEESELGPVPKGWQVERLGDVCSYLNRGISPKYLDEGGVLVVNQKCIRDFSVDYSKGRRHDSSQRKIDGRQLEIGDMLVNSTGVGTLGRIAQVLALDEVTIVDSHVTVVRAGGKISWPFLGQWMIRQQPTIEAMGEGSTGQTELARSKLAMLPILVPAADTMKAFDAIVKLLKKRIAVNETSVSELAKLRDTLLPRLISGQLQMHAPKQSLQEAVT